ncbi:bem46 protein, variant [Polyrhizophydium stewartii]|uniref:Bem46 protein, variant n=1 Tax=Polyrhizophydium stewartii TaxID=2732419 RepID=A0ABR4N1C2_9FUNG|nr:hypothetical protein HK105_002115 [Polyrhizophydium stewartii]
MGVVDTVAWLARAAVYTAVVGAIGVLGMVYMYQNSLIYPASFPAGSRDHVPTPDQFGMPDFEAVTLRTPDGVDITGYLIRRPRFGGAGGRDAAAGPLANVTLLYLHANAGNMGHRLPIAQRFYHQLDCNVFMLSYRGYGLSQGSPNEVGLKIDAQTALDYILAHEQLKNTRVLVFGQSIGGAVAIHLASKNSERIAGLMIENTFLSLRKLIPQVIKLFRPFTFLCHQIWDSEKHIASVTNIPVLFLSSKKDELIPQTHMIKLHAALRKARADAGGPADNIDFVEFPLGQHNDTCLQPGYFDAAERFWRKYLN